MLVHTLVCTERHHNMGIFILVVHKSVDCKRRQVNKSCHCFNRGIAWGYPWVAAAAASAGVGMQEASCLGGCITSQREQCNKHKQEVYVTRHI